MSYPTSTTSGDVKGLQSPKQAKVTPKPKPVPHVMTGKKK